MASASKKKTKSAARPAHGKKPARPAAREHRSPARPPAKAASLPPPARPAAPAGRSQIITTKGRPEAGADGGELSRFAEGLSERFEKGAIEPLLPIRPAARRNFQRVVERAKHRRREIGAFLRGLDLGRT